MQSWETIDSIEEMETMAKNASSPAFTIAYLMGGVMAVFGLINLFKGVQSGDANNYTAARGWLTAFVFYLFGIWVDEPVKVNHVRRMKVSIAN